MQVSRTAIAMFAVTLALSGAAAPESGTRHEVFAAQAAEQNDCVGTWVKESGDSRSHQKITLVLNSDGTYSKRLEATVDGAPYGGTHKGTWTARGLVVNLSGDGNWPPFSHDLASFEKIR